MTLESTRLKTTHLYLDIEKHFATGGGALGVVDLQRMLGLKSKGSVGMYVRLLEDWKLIRRIPHGVRTVVLHPDRLPGYPPVAYRKLPK